MVGKQNTCPTFMRIHFFPHSFLIWQSCLLNNNYIIESKAILQPIHPPPTHLTIYLPPTYVFIYLLIYLPPTSYFLPFTHLPTYLPTYHYNS
jgi:hypothetical protein